MGKFNDLRRVSREIPDGGIDLPQRDLHSSSVKAGGVTAKSRTSAVSIQGMHRILRR
jgi:hypothetical protein